MSAADPVVIVGLGGLFPGGPDVSAFWRNVAAGVDAGRPVPPGRWSLAPEKACLPGELVSDKTYSTWGCYLDALPNSPVIQQRSAEELNGLDPVCRLALETAEQAWQSARLEQVNRQRVGVILGQIVLPTEATSAMARDVVLRTFEERLFSTCRKSPPTAPGQWSSRNRRVAALPAELIADWFQLGGTAYTLDAACASSLYALKLAVDELQSGRADAMLAGGLSRPDCQYTQIGFAQLQALSKQGRCAPLSAAADGLVVGEGAGFFILKRLSDALSAGDRIEAVIAGIGLSNDRGANLLAPHSEGQLRAMQAAYEQAGWMPDEVDYIECHATGTPTGDAVELDSLHQLWEGRPARPGQCVLGAVKSNVGHLLTGAGGAGVMKVLGMLRARQLWPIANFPAPAANWSDADSPFRAVRAAEPWQQPAQRPRRAAVNAFGFGGINAHVLLEEFVPARDSASTHRVRIPTTPADDIVIVGAEASIGPWQNLSAVRDRILGEDDRPPISLSSWGAEQSNWFAREHRDRDLSAYALPEIEIPVGEFRIPPRELPDMLPQQQLMLQVTARALDQSGIGRTLGDRAGVFIGVSLDPNTTNFHCRWMIAERAASWATALGFPSQGPVFDRWVTALQAEFGPPLTANRVMGNLAAITASRIAREFDVGGPSFTISADEDSGLRAAEAAVTALQRGELDLAVVGAVEFGSDLRAQLADLPDQSPHVAHDGAVAFLLKRRADAERDGNRILAALHLDPHQTENHAQINDPPGINQPTHLGYALATTGALDLLKKLLWLSAGLNVEGPQSAAQPRNRRDGLRSWNVACRRGASLRLTEEPDVLADVRSVGVTPQLFVIEGEQRDDILSRLADLERETVSADSFRAAARNWYLRGAGRGAASRALVLIAKQREELAAAIAEARRRMTEQSIRSDRVCYEAQPLGLGGELAFVFPGSGNAFLGMGRELLSAFPGVLQRQFAENLALSDQYRPELIWDGGSQEALARDHKAMIFGQVALGTALCDLLASFGIQPRASIGYSLGESAAMFGLRAWRDRDEMLHRMQRSTLFGSDLVFPFDAARRAWRIPPDQPVPWVSGVINAPAEAVRDGVSRKSRVYLLIINSPQQCVIGGEELQVYDVVRQLSATFVPFPSPSTVHCPILQEVRRDYVELHRMVTTPPANVDFYSSATGERYGLSRDAAAGAILAQATETVDFPRVIQHAWRHGVRLFLEIGPGNSCARMITDILAAEPHWTGALCPVTAEPVEQFLRVLAALIAHRVPVDLSPLFSGVNREQLPDTRPRVKTAVGHAPWEEIPLPKLDLDVREQSDTSVRENGSERVTASGSLAPALPHPLAAPLPHQADASIPAVVAQLRTLLTRRAEAHAAYLRFARRAQALAAQWVTEPGDGNAGFPPLPTAGFEEAFPPPLDHSFPHSHTSLEPPRSLDYQQCLTFAIGRIGDALGPLFAEIDQYPTRVRLPDEPLMLCHRILEIEGEPLSMTRGRLITEHDIVDGAWYLDCGRIPTCIAVEAGQADLFLSGWLGIDLETQGQAVYRLLDAVVTFHDALPGPGKTIRYDIRINRFFRQGETWLFRFEFEATVNGQPLLTMRDGCAGFFSEAELAGGKGIVHTALDRQPRPGKRPNDWTDPVPMTVESYTDAQLTALRRGDLASCFGLPFRSLPIRNPVTIPGEIGNEFANSPLSRGEEKNNRGRMRLVDRVLHLDPSGGKYGLGLIRAEADIHPDDWFLTCHFCDDQVMPGTLMYECCLHTLRIYLLRMGWIGEAGDIVYEPIPEVRSRLKCRGQVLATTKKVWYEVTIKELGYGEGERREVRGEREQKMPLFPRFGGKGGRRPDEGVVADRYQTNAPPLPNPLPNPLPRDGGEGTGLKTLASNHSSLAASYAYCLADALMYADGKPIVEMTDMSIRLTGLTREKVERLWRVNLLSGGREAPDDRVAARGESKQGANAPCSVPLFDTSRITEFAVGMPSKAFGDKYRIFDHDRVIARLPGPPFQFLDRIVSIENCAPWKLAAGGTIVAEYDVPQDAWYFSANRQPAMPFAVLLETALQPCGWLAAYLGSALTSDVDLSFRNLGGKATQFQAVTANSGTLTTTVKITSVSQSAGMIIQHYSFDLRCRGEPVYQGTTYFGFFSKGALANQIGIRDAAKYQPTEGEIANGTSFAVPHDAPFPTDRFRMVDRVDLFVPDGGPQGLGYLRGSIDVDPSFWFFQAHFYQDPVWPGSLGLESFLQLLKVYAARRWGESDRPRSASEISLHRFQTVALNSPHEWVYRGQVIPKDKTVTVDVVITAVDDAARKATASGFLTVDSRVIYQMIDFTIQDMPS